MGPYFPVPLGFGFSNVVAIVAAFVVAATILGASVVSTILPLAARASDLVRHLILRLGVVDVLAVTTLLVTIAIGFLALVAVLLDATCAWVSMLVYSV